ncbi:MAG: glycosyltransferase [Candidatus Marinimicrobia bacterium]|nr:glycosyltransferase [Candidatus Neomarinimicrobiota bacterium]
MSKEPTTVSVIIPAYNAAKTISRCLNSILHQDYPSDNVDIHLVNDGSTDNTNDVLQQIVLSNQVQIHNHIVNKGLASARNTGLHHSNGEIIIFLDADMEVSPDFIENHVRFHKKPNVVGLLSALLPAPENPIDKYQKYLYQSKRGAKKYPVQTPLPFHAFILGITSIKRHAISETGGFDKAISSYGGEDTEFAYRLWQKYLRGLYYAPHIKVIHHHYRPFNAVLENVRTFGREVVPYLVQKHPEFDSLYGYSYIYPSSTFIGLIKKIVGIILKSKNTFTLLKLLYHLFPYPFSNKVIRLLLASALWQGIARSKKNDSTR